MPVHRSLQESQIQFQKHLQVHRDYPAEPRRLVSEAFEIFGRRLDMNSLILQKEYST